MRLGLTALAAAVFLTGCGATDWLGEGEDPPLPGRRIAIFADDQSLRADASDRDVALPRPYVNETWPQAHGYPTNAMYHLAVGTGAERLGALDIGAGADEDRPLLSAPIIGGGAIFALDADGRATAFDASTGRRIWSYRLSPEEEEDSYLGGGLAFDDGVVVAALSTARAMALRAADGALLWETRLDGPARAAPTVIQGRAFVTSVDNRVVALDMENGRRLWSHEAPVDSAALLGGSTPASDGEIVVVAYSNVEAVNLA
ncbi:MAG: PQQ-binding-like beta-propeller repeat protein, partial [Pseudomonadota bacterium]